MKGLRCIVGAGLLFAWVGVLCRGRDSSLIPAVVYYATPWLFCAIAGGLAAFVLKGRIARLFAAALTLTALSDGWKSFQSDQLPPECSAGSTVAVWNTGRQLAAKREAWAEVSEADISAVIETGDFSPARWKEFTASSPGYEWKRLDPSTMIGVRGRILSVEDLGVYDLFRCHRVAVEIPMVGQLNVIVVDVRSQPWISRERAMAGIREAAGDDPKAVILGDFNTPAGSVWYRDWRESGLTLANEGPRNGFRETWAYGLPLWTLDQIWLGPGWKSLLATKSNPGSDHARVMCVFGEW